MNLLPTGLVLAGLLLGGCGTMSRSEHPRSTLARIFLESADANGTAMTLPGSGVRLMVNPQPVLVEGDFTNVELVHVELGLCLMFQLSPAAARDFYRLSGSHQGRRLILAIDGAPIGARRVDGPIADGVIFMFVEWADDALPQLVGNLKQTTVALQREIARKT